MNEWNNVEDGLPDVDRPLWYYFEPCGVWKGTFEGLYIDEDGKTWKGMHIFLSECKRYWLTGDVTHWQYANGQEKPIGPVH